MRGMCLDHGASQLQVADAHSTTDLVHLLQRAMRGQARGSPRANSGQGRAIRLDARANAPASPHSRFASRRSTNLGHVSSIASSKSRTNARLENTRQEGVERQRREQQRAIVLYDFSPGSRGQVSLSTRASAGTTVQILALGKTNPSTGTPDWVKGINHLGKTGWFPFSYIQILNSESETRRGEAKMLAEAESAAAARASRIGLN